MWTTGTQREFLSFGNQDVIVNLAYVTSVTVDEKYIYFNMSSGKYTSVKRHDDNRDIWPSIRKFVMADSQKIPL